MRRRSGPRRPRPPGRCAPPTATSRTCARTRSAAAGGGPRQKIAECVAARHLQVPQLVDEQFHLADALGQRRVPATLVLDRDGRVRYTGGVLDRAALSALRDALGGG